MLHKNFEFCFNIFHKHSSEDRLRTYWWSLSRFEAHELFDKHDQVVKGLLNPIYLKIMVGLQIRSDAQEHIRTGRLEISKSDQSLNNLKKLSNRKNLKLRKKGLLQNPSFFFLLERELVSDFLKGNH